MAEGQQCHTERLGPLDTGLPQPDLTSGHDGSSSVRCGLDQGLTSGYEWSRYEEPIRLAVMHGGQPVHEWMLIKPPHDRVTYAE